MHAMDVARTHEILARYRPIAPKPPLPDKVPLPTEKAKGGSGSRVPAKIPRTRKRGRGNHSGPSFAYSHKKSRRTYVPVLPSTSVHHHALPRGTYTVFGVPRAGPLPSVDKVKGGGEEGGGEPLTLSLLPHCPPTPASEVKEKDLDLNSDPVERDLLGGLDKPCNVIVPQPVRPVGSSISIGCISEEHGAGSAPAVGAKRPQEVEEEVEREPLPAVVSDSNHRVRLANSAYKEMIGQPQCLWLDTMAGGTGTRVASGNRISGEVMLRLSEAPVRAGGFSCRAKIEWTRNDGKKKHLTAPCNVARLACDSKDYAFTWRFHTDEATVSSCN